ncbi:MAG: lysophospholipid acyltransferase family protein [Leptospirillia bacterium]
MTAPPERSLSFRLTFAGLGLVRWLFCLLPGPAALFLGERFGDLLRLLLPGKVRILRDNLSRSDLAPGSPEEARRFERHVFRHFGRLGAEFLRLCELSDRDVCDLVPVEGLEYFRREYEKGQGVILLTGHLGNWEMALRRIAVEAPGKAHPVIRRIKNRAVNDFIDRHRHTCGKGDSLLADLGPKPLIRALRAGEVLIFLLDQNAGEGEGIFVPFLGRPAATYTSLARLSLMTGRPVLPAACQRLIGGRFRGRILPPILPETSLPPEEAAAHLTTLYGQALDSLVRDYPEQWIWMHRRWKTRPPGEPAPSKDMGPGLAS